jgi:hypothetical protein
VTAAVGKVWLPREKIQRTDGSEREAGCEARTGISKNVSDKMPPEAMRLVPTERMSVVLVASEDMIVQDYVSVFENFVNNLVMRKLSVLYGAYYDTLTTVRKKMYSGSESVFAGFETSSGHLKLLGFAELQSTGDVKPMSCPKRLTSQLRAYRLMMFSCWFQRQILFTRDISQ